MKSNIASVLNVFPTSLNLVTKQRSIQVISIGVMLRLSQDGRAVSREGQEMVGRGSTACNNDVRVRLVFTGGRSARQEQGRHDCCQDRRQDCA